MSKVQKYNKEYKAAYYQANKEKMKAQQKDRYEKDKEGWKVKGRKRRLRYKYFPHFSVEEAHLAYWDLHEKQKGLCAICNKPETKIDPQQGKPCVLAVDHDHVTNKVRALLCFRCNTNLGWFESMKEQFSNYLEKY